MGAACHHTCPGDCHFGPKIIIQFRLSTPPDEASRRKLDRSSTDSLDQTQAKDPIKIPELWEDLPLPPGKVPPLE
jgi:hypothetical protein